MITKDFTVPLSKDSFKAALEAYSIGMPTSPDTETAMLQTSRRVLCRGSEAQQSPNHTSAKAIAVNTGTLLCAAMVNFGKGKSGCLMVVFPDAAVVVYFYAPLVPLVPEGEAHVEGWRVHLW